MPQWITKGLTNRQKITILLLIIFAPITPTLCGFLPLIISCERQGVWGVVSMVMLLIIVLASYLYMVSVFCQASSSKNTKILFINFFGLYFSIITFGSMLIGAMKAANYCYN